MMGTPDGRTLYLHDSVAAEWDLQRGVWKWDEGEQSLTLHINEYKMLSVHKPIVDAADPDRSAKQLMELLSYEGSAHVLVAHVAVIEHQLQIACRRIAELEAERAEINPDP